MKHFHVEYRNPDGHETILNSVPAKTAQAAIENAIRAAGYTGFRYVWTQGYGVDYPAGKRPAMPVYSNGKDFIHAIAWTI